MLLVDFLKNNNLLTPDLKLVCIRNLSDCIFPTYVFREDFYKVVIPGNIKPAGYSFSDELKMYSDGEAFLRIEKKSGILHLTLE